MSDLRNEGECEYDEGTLERSFGTLPRRPIAAERVTARPRPNGCGEDYHITFVLKPTNTCGSPQQSTAEHRGIAGVIQPCSPAQVF